MAAHRLTQPRVAELADVSLKTVEGWLAGEHAASRRTMHHRYLRLIRAALAESTTP
jgi:DNA-binding transcriptional regulator YiaG